MKILHTADWHIGQFKGPVVDGVNLRLQDTVKCLEYMVEVAQKEKPDIVCISGDIFHQEQIGPVRYSDEMIIATDTITKLADIAKGVIVMRGTPNHDGSGQFRVLDRMFAKTSHVHIITAPTVLHTPYTDIACIPGFDKQEFRAKFPGLSADEENLAYREFPQLEWFIKMGLYKLAAHLINEFHDGAFGYESRNGIRGLRKSGKTIFEILGLTKENTRILQSIDGNIDELRLLQEAQSSGYNLKVEELERFYKLFGCNTTLIRKENRKSTIHKICRYIEREGADYRVGESGQCWRYSYMQRKERPDIREERLQNCAKDWLDYLNWCKELKYDLNNMFFYFPKNFKKVHDRTAAEYQALQDKKAAEKKRREDERIKREAEVMKKLLEEMLKENAGIDNAFLIKGKGLILRVPRDTQEIKNEGAALHHCVGTYVDRVAKGQTHIFFVRRVEEPDTPYFTMEYNNGRVIQCRGNHNCGMPASVKAFVAAFEKLMKEREEKMERKCG